VKIYPCNVTICNKPDIQVEAFGYYHHFFAQENVAHTLLENYLPIYVLMLGWGVDTYSKRLILAVQNNIGNMNKHLSVLFGFDRILSIENLPTTKFKHLVIGTFGASFNSMSTNNFDSKQFEDARNFLLRRIQPIIETSSFSIQVKSHVLELFSQMKG
jgi:hypothetical protein